MSHKYANNYWEKYAVVRKKWTKDKYKKHKCVETKRLGVCVCAVYMWVCVCSSKWQRFNIDARNWLLTCDRGAASTSHSSVEMNNARNQLSGNYFINWLTVFSECSVFGNLCFQRGSPCGHYNSRANWIQFKAFGSKHECSKWMMFCARKHILNCGMCFGFSKFPNKNIWVNVMSAWNVIWDGI